MPNGKPGTRSATSSPASKNDVIRRLHRAADDVATGALRVPRLYREGFGDRSALERVVAQIRDYDVGFAALPLRIHWGAPRAFGRGVRRAGWFRSPTLHISLPRESRVAYIEEIVPKRAPPTAMVVHLAASGEVGFVTRRAFARRLLRHGYGSILLENPFYGMRRPAGQRHAALRTVAEQFAMNFATVEEGRALLAHLHRNGHRVAVTGYSQGGVMAAFCAALSRFPVAVSPRGAADSVADLFTRDNFSQIIRWDRLARDVGGELEARRLFREALEVVTVSRFPAPVRPDAAVLLSGRHDRFVAPEQALALHRHWPGSALRWLDAGHVTGIVLNAPAHLRAVRESIERLRHGADRHTL